MPTPRPRLLALTLQVALIAAVVLLGTLPAEAASDVYTIDKGHSTVLFRVQHLGVSWAYGRFNDFNGSFNFDAEDASKSSVEVDISADSVDTADEKRDDHLKNADFLDVEEYPSIGFKSTKCTKVKDKQYSVAGNFTLHGVTKEITLRMDKVGEGKDPWGNYRMGFIGHVTVKRSDYGMDKMIPMVGDDIHITLSIEGIKQKAK